MKNISSDTPITYSNPLDLAEELLNQREWPSERVSDEELAAEFIGTWCDIRAWISWKPETGSFMLNCTFDTKVVERTRPKVHTLLALVNEKLWLGHFTIDSTDGAISFRYTILTTPGSVITGEQIDDIIDISYSECERFYPAMQSVIWSGRTPHEALEAAIFETVGEA